MEYKILQRFWGSQNGRDRARKSGALLLTSVILIFLLPLDSAGEVDVVTSAGYWFSDALVLTLFTGMLARRFLPWAEAKALPPTIGVLLYTGLAAIPLLLVSLLYGWAVVGGYVHDESEAGWQGLLGGYGTSDYLWWTLIIYINTLLLIGPISLAAVKFSSGATTDNTPQANNQSKPLAGQKFLNRLSPDLGTDLLCLAMEDHYVRVHTSLGDELIHMRMTDAMTELEGYAGYQVHRSWWIATTALKNITKDGRKHTAQLVNGLEVPIARNRVAELKKAGLI